MSFGKVSAEISWSKAIMAYRETDDALSIWEQEKNYTRGTETVASIDALTLRLTEANFPSEIVKLYRIRFDQYQALIRLSEAYKPFEARIPNISLALPETATLPIQFKVEEQNRLTFSPAVGTLAQGNELSLVIIHPDEKHRLILAKCTSRPGACSSAANVKLWKLKDYSPGDVLTWVIGKTGKYYLWSRKLDVESTESAGNEIVYSRDQAKSTIIHFKSGLKIQASVLRQ